MPKTAISGHFHWTIRFITDPMKYSIEVHESLVHIIRRYHVGALTLTVSQCVDVIRYPFGDIRCRRRRRLYKIFFAHQVHFGEATTFISHFEPTRAILYENQSFLLNYQQTLTCIKTLKAAKILKMIFWSRYKGKD